MCFISLYLVNIKDPIFYNETMLDRRGIKISFCEYIIECIFISMKEKGTMLNLQIVPEECVNEPN